MITSWLLKQCLDRGNDSEPMEKKYRKWSGKNMRQKDEILSNLDLHHPVYLPHAGKEVILFWQWSLLPFLCSSAAKLLIHSMKLSTTVLSFFFHAGQVASLIYRAKQPFISTFSPTGNLDASFLNQYAKKPFMLWDVSTNHCGTISLYWFVIYMYKCL